MDTRIKLPIPEYRQWVSEITLDDMPTDEEVRLRHSPALIAYLESKVCAGLRAIPLDLPKSGCAFAENMGPFRILCFFCDDPNNVSKFMKWTVRADVCVA